ncbi:MAG TPA: hypothetical protein VEV41_16395 [Terriglobales bacterium]|nr:hypothetical protein [Terriglobales bacterium]
MRKELFAGIGIVVVAMMSLSSRLSAGEESKKRGVTVADTIRMATVPEPQYAAQDASKNRVAIFSPDKKHFVIVVERGILETNEREFSLLLYESAEIFRSSEPKVLVTLRSHSNRDAIRNVRWIDAERIVFLGEARSTSQVYSLRIADSRMEQLTDHATPLIDFDLYPKSQIIAYAAERSRLNNEAAYERCARGYAIINEALDDIPRSLEDCKEPSLLLGAEVYVKKPGRQPFPIVFADYFEAFKQISISPNGKYVLFDVLLRKVPASWKDYQDPLIHAEAMASRNRGPFSWLSQFLVADTSTGEVRPIVDGTIDLTLGAAAWSPDGSSVVVSGAFLPLDVNDPEELEARKAHSFIVEVNPSTRAFSKVSDKQLIADRWNTETGEVSLRPPAQDPEGGFAIYRKTEAGWREATANLRRATGARPEVSLEQDLNSAPRIFVSDAQHREKQLLLDLNPQFRELQFAKVERVTWRAKDGHEVEGGLYYPLHYRPGTRYPAVLQTHGFSRQEFWINGPWNSAFAAQPLAARDILVLQIGYATEQGADTKVWRTPEEAPRQMSAYEGAVDYLDSRALIDRNRVGIIGFSRTVYSVEYTLTHSSYHFAAATVADGFDGGYLQYLVNPYSKRDWMTVNGGEPFGATLDLWRERSPSFTVDRLRTPVRLEGYGGISAVIGNWEWYAKLVMLDRPADMIYLPDATHLLVKPWERMTSQEGNVDWFSFWLKGEIDSVPEKREQYARWKEMLEKQR